MREKIATYADLVAIQEGTSAERLVPVNAFSESIISSYEKFDMLPYTGDTIYVREGLAQLLAQAQRTLVAKHLSLRVVYGYRHPEIQTKYFLARKNALKVEYPELTEDALVARTHDFVAVPAVGGHPAGAAVDITLVDASETPLDMGTGIADYTQPKIIRTFAPGLTGTQIANRKLLHDTMLEQGFAPFYGEWWHYSYGDREWAYFYDKSCAIYGQIDFRTIEAAITSKKEKGLLDNTEKS